MSPFHPLPAALEMPPGWSLPGLFIAVVIVAACVALVWVALRQFNIPIPQWVIQVFWIVIVAIVVIVAIRIVAGL